MNAYGLTCIHMPAGGGLCPACQADYDYDPDSFLEFGNHFAGLARWRKLKEEMDAAHREPIAPSVPDGDIPY